MCDLRQMHAAMLLASLLEVLLGQHYTRLLSTMAGVIDAI